MIPTPILQTRLPAMTIRQIYEALRDHRNDEVYNENGADIYITDREENSSFTVVFNYGEDFHVSIEYSPLSCERMDSSPADEPEGLFAEGFVEIELNGESYRDENEDVNLLDTNPTLSAYIHSVINQ